MRSGATVPRLWWSSFWLVDSHCVLTGRGEGESGDRERGLVSSLSLPLLVRKLIPSCQGLTSDLI